MNKERWLWGILRGAVIACGFTLVLAPLLLILINTFKTMQEAGKDFFALPSTLNLSNYRELFAREDFASSLQNSLLVTVVAVALIVTVVPATAYAIARNLHKVYYKLVYYYILVGIFIPFQVLMLPMVKQMTNVHMLNQGGLILLHLTFSLPMGVFLFVNYIRSISYEIEEAAIMDGCSTLQTYTKVVIHLVKPMIATIVVIDSLAIWNDFMMALLILNKGPEMWTLPLMQYNFKAEFSFNYTMAFTAYLVCMAPIVVIYAFGQKFIIKGLTSGAVKL